MKRISAGIRGLKDHRTEFIFGWLCSVFLFFYEPLWNNWSYLFVLYKLRIGFDNYVVFDKTENLNNLNPKFKPI